MRAVTFDCRLELADRPKPACSPGEALVRVLRAGICNTDLEIVRGYMRFRGVLGHEFVGQVVESPRPEQVGCRVVGEINSGCGRCAPCLSGLGRHCPTRTVLGILGRDGALAEYLTLPAQNLHLVPESLSNEEATFVEPLAAALEIAEQVHLRPGARALVLGAGKLGLLVAQVLAQRDLEVTALCRREERRALLGSWRIASAASAAELDAQYELVVEATGAPEGLALAIEKTRPRGTLVLKSTYAARVSLDLAPCVVNELSLVGSRCGPFAPALSALARKAGAVTPLIDRPFPLTRALEAFSRAAEPGVLKVLVDPGC